MSKDKDKSEELSIEEGADGSAVIDLPEDMSGVDATEEHIEAKPEEKADKNDIDEDADHPDDGEELRAAKRNRRRAKKELIRKTNEEKDQRLAMLQRQNQELMERLSVVERKTQSSDLARLDKAIEDEELRIQYFEAKKREAINNSDGDAFNKAQDAWYEARRKVEAMRSVKQQAVQTSGQETGAVNPKLMRHANAWMDSNSWYDPNGEDEDSQIAKVIDNKLVREGWDPTTEEYWEELDARLQERIPHRYNDFNDDEPRQVKRPRNVVGSSGREASAAYGGSNRTQFVLSPERVRAMKEAGAWDNPERKAKMIKQFIEYDRTNRN